MSRQRWPDDLGDVPGEDDIRNGLWKREGIWSHPDTYVLGEHENWHYLQVGDDWDEHVAEQLARHGIQWDHRNTNRITVPDGVTDDEARHIWQETVAGFDKWLDNVVDEVMRGKPGPDADDVRSPDAPGWRWIIEALDN
jgi:hypothetical protein